MSIELYYKLLYVWIAIALITFPMLLKITQPYGRHSSTKFGPMIDNKLGWMIQEGVAPFFMLFWYIQGSLEKTLLSQIFVSIYVAHYIYRGFIFPMRLKTKGKKMPLVICLSAVFFNFCNTFFLGYYLGNIGANYAKDYLFSFPFIFGSLIFLLGLFINHTSDNILINLRTGRETGYKIPTGFLFKYISCPNHFGEIIQWLGFAVMLNNLAG